MGKGGKKGKGKSSGGKCIPRFYSSIQQLGRHISLCLSGVLLELFGTLLRTNENCGVVLLSFNCDLSVARKHVFSDDNYVCFFISFSY